MAAARAAEERLQRNRGRCISGNRIVKQQLATNSPANKPKRCGRDFQTLQEEFMERKHAVYRRKIIAVLVLLAAWQLLSCLVDRAIFLPSVPDTLCALIELARTKDFYLSVGTSFLRIAAGFLLAAASGALLAVFAELNAQLREILQLLMQLIKSIPVASFVILVLLWVRSAQLSIVISFLMVLPVIFTNISSGIQQTDQKLLEMAWIFDLSLFCKIRYIYLPAVWPAFVTACSVGLGFCWKSGIAAEVIGLPAHSIGTQLYEAKLYLMTPELFAWTIVIVFLSSLFEKAVMLFVQRKFTRKRPGTTGQNVSAASSKQLSPRDSRPHAGSNVPVLPFPENDGKHFPDGFVTHSTPWEDAAKKTPAGFLSAKNLHKQFGGQLVLSDVSLTVQPGERLCIMGASGVGKTTLLLILAGLVKQDSGEVVNAKHGRLSMVFQEDRLLEDEDAFLNAAVAGNLPGKYRTSSPYTAQYKAADGRQSGNLYNWLREEFEQIGLKDYEGKPVSDFSGGMRRRVAIVRAVCSDADIVLFDEPFRGLDSQSRIQAARYVKKRMEGRTLIAVTHDSVDAELLDAKIWVLKH